MLGGESAFLQVDLLQSATKEQEFKVLSLGGGLNATPTASPTQAFPPKVEGQISMTMEVSELLSQAALDTSSQALGTSSPKRPGSLALASSLPLKLEDSVKLVDTSSQVSIPDDVDMDDPTLEEINASSSRPVGTPEGSGDAPPLDVTQLQEEDNKAMGCLLAMKSTIDAHQRKEVSDFGMVLCHNESEVTEAIKQQRPFVPVPSGKWMPAA